MNYPFEPKSTSHFEPGQYWAIPLDDGNFACGVVVAKVVSHGHKKPDSRIFLAALIDWCGEQTPSDEAVSGAKLIKLRYAHIKTILETGGAILGKTGFDFLGENPRSKTDEILTMGYGVFKQIAEKKFS